MTTMFVPAVKTSDGVLLVPTDSDYYDVTEKAAREAGELLIDVIIEHNLEPYAVVKGTAEDFRSKSVGTRVYSEIEFLEILN